jgi:hypothetical protein
MPISISLGWTLQEKGIKVSKMEVQITLIRTYLHEDQFPKRYCDCKTGSSLTLVST